MFTIWNNIKIKQKQQLKLIKTGLLFSVFLLLFSGIIQFPQSISQAWQNQGQTYLTQTLENSAKTFLVARGINAGISVLQSVTITPILAAISIGEILDPINDLIERFSWIMLLVTISLGIQQLLLQITGNLDILSLVYFILALSILSVWWRNSRQFIVKLIFVLLLIRLSIVLMLVGVKQLDQHFLRQSTQEHIAMLAIEQQRLEKTLDDSWGSSAKSKLNNLKQQTEKVLTSLLHLATLFIFKTLVLPLMIWVLIGFLFKQLLYLER